MSAAKHTPGPWTPTPNYGGTWVIETPRRRIAYVQYAGDGPLIAAAPDLLAAGTRLLSEVRALLGEDDCGCNGTPPLCAVCEMRDAIAKATGEVKR